MEKYSKAHTFYIKKILLPQFLSQSCHDPVHNCVTCSTKIWYIIVDIEGELCKCQFILGSSREWSYLLGLHLLLKD